MESRLTYQQQANESTVTTASTIAVFGATTKTGQAFVRLALDAGYQVRALLGNSKKMETQTNLEWIVGSLNDEQAIEDCVRHVDFVVCTLAEHKFKKQKNMLRDFVVRLYPIMKEQRTVQVFLFQVRERERKLRHM
jgi:putative NADH-flavin reductase